MTNNDVLQVVRQHQVQMAHLLHTLDLVPGAAAVVGAADVAPIVDALNGSLRDLEAELHRRVGRV